MLSLSFYCCLFSFSVFIAKSCHYVVVERMWLGEWSLGRLEEMDGFPPLPSKGERREESRMII